MKIKILFLFFITSLRAGIFDAFTSKEFAGYRAYNELPLEIQTSIAQRLLQNTLSGKALKTHPSFTTSIYKQNYIGSMALSPDGTKLALGKSHEIIILDFATAKIINSLKLPDKSWHAQAIAWKPDGTQLAANTGSNQVTIWDTKTGNHIHTFYGDKWDGSVAIAWSPDGTKLAATSGEKIKILDTNSWNTMHTLTCHATGVIRSIAWSPDGTQLASASHGEIFIWMMDTTNTWTNIQTFSYWASSVAWSPDGTQLASCSADKTIKIWDTNTWVNTETLTGHTKAVGSIAWSPDGTQLVSDSDRTIKVWDAKTWNNIYTLVNDLSNTSVIWGPNNTQLISLSYEHGKPYCELSSIITQWQLPKPLLTQTDWDNLTLEQTLFLILLYTQRPKYSLKPLKMWTLDPRLSYEDAQSIFNSFSPSTQTLLSKNYTLKHEPTLTPHEQYIYWGF